MEYSRERIEVEYSREMRMRAPDHETDVHSGASERLTAERGQMLAALSNAVVAIHKQYYGKGPTKARAHLSQDLLTVVLDGGYTRGEQTLHDRGHAHEVVQSRLAMQSAVEGEFRAAVEGILGRPVRSFMSANDPSNDLQVEIFVLHPRAADASDSDAPSGEELGERARRAREQHRELLEEHRALRSEQAQSVSAVHRERDAKRRR
jgi:uncharacterized protein YbcI